MILWPPDVASEVGDVCSALGLIVTALLTGGAIRERNRLLRLIFYPQHVERLDAHCAKLSSFLGESVTADELSKEIGEARGDLNSLRAYLQRGQSNTFAEILTLLDGYDRNRTDRNLSRLLPKMYQLLAEMRNLSEGLKF